MKAASLTSIVSALLFVLAWGIGYFADVVNEYSGLNAKAIFAIVFLLFIVSVVLRIKQVAEIGKKLIEVVWRRR
jgi:hypothetical protein